MASSAVRRAVVEATVPDQRLRVHGQDARTQVGGLGPDELECLATHQAGLRVGLGRAQRLHAREQEPRTRQCRRVGGQPGQVGVDQGQRRLGPTRAAERVHRAGHQLGLVGRVGEVRRRATVDLQRLRVVPRRLVRSTGGQRLIPGLDACLKGGGQVVRGECVSCEVGRLATAVELAHRLGVRRVQAHAFAGQQVVVDRLAQQCVAEGVLRVAGADEHVGVDGVAQRDLELVLGHRRDPGEQVMGHPLAGGRRDPDDVARGLVEAVEPHEQQVGEVLGQAPAATQEGADELLDVEGVALRALHDPLDVVVVLLAERVRRDGR